MGRRRGVERSLSWIRTIRFFAPHPIPVRYPRFPGGPMTIAVGDQIPDVELWKVTDEGFSSVRSTEVLGEGKVVLFAVPGAFTPTCSDHHLPGFVIRSDDLLAKGVDRIVCLSVNDPFVMKAWGQDQKVGDAVVMVADGNGAF